MEDEGWTTDKEMWEVILTTRKLFKKLDDRIGEEMKKMAKPKSQDDDSSDEVQVDGAFLKYLLRMVQKRLHEETQKYAALQDEVLATRDRMVADKKRIAKIKDKLRFLCCMSDEANEWMDDLEASEDCSNSSP